MSNSTMRRLAAGLVFAALSLAAATSNASPLIGENAILADLGRPAPVDDVSTMADRANPPLPGVAPRTHTLSTSNSDRLVGITDDSR